MIWTLVDALLIALGSLSFFLLFYRTPGLPPLAEPFEAKSTDQKQGYPDVSIIIPARNEEHSLALLLADLSKQSVRPKEIICVDDQSTDRTAAVIRSFSARLISVDDKPANWFGKSWACQIGSNVATSDLFLFLDADVRLGRYGLERLLKAFQKQSQTVSVQPYHRNERFYEQFSFIFNLLQFAANGLGRPKGLQLGLFGPVILMPKAAYESIGGHESVRGSIVEDVDLGRRLTTVGLGFDLYVGDRDVSYRMYHEGFLALCRGWIKNIATGAGRASLPIFSMVFLWLTALTSVPLHLVTALRESLFSQVIIFSILYAFYAILLRIHGRRLGNYRVWTSIFYPAVLLVFLAIFLVSTVFKAFGLQVTWKGRQISGRIN